jgi:hypothetical protein
MDKGEQVRVRKDLAEGFEGFFTPAHAGEPVVDERDAQRPILPRRVAPLPWLPVNMGIARTLRV